MYLTDRYYDDIATFYAAMDLLSDNLSINAKRRITFRFGEEIRKAIDAEKGMKEDDARLIKGWLR